MFKLKSFIVGSSLLLLSQFGACEIGVHQTAANSQVIGISLTATHVTASRRYSNGSVRDLGRVNARSEYVELIEGLTSWDSEHPSPPYSNMEDMWNDWPRQIVRSTRKAFGLPASLSVATLANMLQPIIGLIEETDSSPIAALISFPALRGLYQEDIVDAASYVGLIPIADGYEYHPHELVATFAGHGLGLSPIGDDPDEYEHRPTLLVEYTEKALLLHHNYMTKAIEIPGPDMQLQMSFELGSDQNPDQKAITNFVLNFLYDEYVGRARGPVPKKVTVLMAGSAQSFADKRVEKAILFAVRAIGCHWNSRSENPEYMAARGAAELAWRALEPKKGEEP